MKSFRLLWICPVVLVALALGGCATEGKPLTGSGTTLKDGKIEHVTYVTMEEFQRMTQAERDRLHAQVGYAVPIVGSKKQQTTTVSEDELRKALGK